jgi:NADH dehydrogenase
VVVGSGFAGLTVLRHLEARLPAEAADLVLVSPVDHLPYTSLLPQVCAAEVEPRHLAVAVHGTLKRTVPLLGHAVGVDRDGRTLTIRRIDGGRRRIGWDRLVLAPGSVTRTFDIPGLADHALGLKNLAEAVYLRDHVLRQLEYADACEDDEAERRARCSFVVVGAGYTGTELAAQMRRFTTRALDRYPRLRGREVRWLLADLAPRVLPELGTAMSEKAAAVLTRRGVEVRLETSLSEVTAGAVRLTDGEVVPTHTVVWCAGVAPSPLIGTLGLATTKGRLNVDECFRVPSADGLFALGDAAAVPDVTRDRAPAGQTAQHAIREGAVAARNVAASLGYGTPRGYKHRDLGFVVDLGGVDAVANPLGVTLAGLPAAAVTRGYHLYALSGATNRARVAVDWALAALAPAQPVQLGFLPAQKSSITAAEDTDIYA